MARDQGGLGVEQIVDVVGDFVWIDAADIEEAYERLDDNLRA